MSRKDGKCIHEDYAIRAEKKIEKLQEQNKELLELLKEADSVIDDYLNWRDEKRMDYFDIRARKLREALGELIHHCRDYGITSESFAICMAVNQAVQAIEKVSKIST